MREEVLNISIQKETRMEKQEAMVAPVERAYFSVHRPEPGSIPGARWLKRRLVLRRNQ